MGFSLREDVPFETVITPAFRETFDTYIIEDDLFEESLMINKATRQIYNVGYTALLADWMRFGYIEFH